MNVAARTDRKAFIGRHFQTGELIRLTLDGPRIGTVETLETPELTTPNDDWLAPAFWDIQINGRWGISFSDPTLTVDQVAAIVRSQAALGTARLCPTLITASQDHLVHGLSTIAEACERDPEIGERVLGIHLEGPYISPLDGYRGAHPLEAVREPDWIEFEILQRAAKGRIVVITMAPEYPGALEFIEDASARGIVLALAHTAAEPATLHAAAAAGARLSTHLGNGIAATLPRHPNAIWAQAADDRLSASLIADGHHLDRDVLRVLARAKTASRVILVSDASPLAGLPPGNYGDWAVDPSGKIVVAGTPYLAGSNQGLDVGVNVLREATDLPVPELFRTVTENPARLLGKPTPRLEPGQPACFIRFRDEAGTLVLQETCVDGVLADPGDADRPAALV